MLNTGLIFTSKFVRTLFKITYNDQEIKGNESANIEEKLVAYGFESFMFVFEGTVKLFGHLAILIPYSILYFCLLPVFCLTKIWKYVPGPLTVFY